jgi:hypothetical protein
MTRNPIHICVACTAAALLMMLGGCLAEPEVFEGGEFQPAMDFPGLGDDGSEHLEFDEDPGELELGDPEPSGEIHIDVADLVVEVGDEVVISFTAEVWEVDPEETYFTVSGAPDTADIDTTIGLFSWIPAPADVGEHLVGFDLWWATEGRILDAQRVVIEVVPGNSLIEVGI